MVLCKGSRIIVSACLLGVRCNYKAEASAVYQQRPLFWESVCQKFTIFPVCPEQLGGMSTPRIPAELKAAATAIIGGQGSVESREGIDVTSCFLKGGEETVRIAKLLKADFAVLKSNSPSCGNKMIYDGTFAGVLVAGSGIAVQMLADAEIKTFDEAEFLKMCQGTFSEFSSL